MEPEPPETGQVPAATSQHCDMPTTMQEPLQFVRAGENALKLIKENIEALETENRPVTVVSAVGELRIGKSYLLTRIMRASLPPGMPKHYLM
jgi:hypothetical protein